MKTGDRRRICWDCTCWLAWLNGEGTDIWPAKVVQGIADVVDEVEKYRAVLFTSTILRIEVLNSRLTDQQKETFRKVMRRSNVKEEPPLPAVIDKAAELRNCLSKEGRRIQTPDAIYLATAMIYEAHEFHTMDGLGKNESRRKLLAISGHDCVEGLKIVHPYPLNEIPPEELIGKELAPIEGPIVEQIKVAEKEKTKTNK